MKASFYTAISDFIKNEKLTSFVTLIKIEKIYIFATARVIFYWN